MNYTHMFYMGHRPKPDEAPIKKYLLHVRCSPWNVHEIHQLGKRIKNANGKPLTRNLIIEGPIHVMLSEPWMPIGIIDLKKLLRRKYQVGIKQYISFDTPIEFKEWLEYTVK